jgi:hypothetical protein
MTALRVAPAGGDRIHLELGRELHDRRLDTTGAEEKPIEIFRPQGIAERRRQPGFRITLGDIGADRGGFASVASPSFSAGTLPIGLIARYSARRCAPVEMSVSTRS